MKRAMIVRPDEKYREWQRVIDLWHGHENSVILSHAAYGESIPYATFANRLRQAKAAGIKPSVAFGCHVRPAYLQQGPQQAPMSVPQFSGTAGGQFVGSVPVAGGKPRVTVTAAMQSGANRSVLVISDLHAPFQHPDALRFLAALKEKYQPDRVVCIGDEIDYHALSYHDHDPDLPSAGHELQHAREVMRELERMFPDVDVLDSNHGSLLFRKAITHGIPRLLLVEYRDALFGVKDAKGNLQRPGGAGDGWNWHQTLTLDLPTGNRCTFAHGRSKSARRNVEVAGTCYVQGHHHTSFEIVYHSTPDFLNWSMTVGCLIDDKQPAFRYAAGTIARQIIGCGLIIDGLPRLTPMLLAKGGRWTGFVP